MSGLGPLDVTSIIERLRAQVPALKLVGDAADRAAVEDNTTPTTPAAFVILAWEDIKTTPTSGIYIHHVRARVDVIYQVRHYRAGQRGASQNPVLRDVINAGRAALNNWLPTAPSGAQIETLTGSGKATLLALRQNDSFWLDPFETTYRGTA